MKTIDTKEISNYKRELTTAVNYSQGLVIKNQDDYELALAEGKRIKIRLDAIIGRREEITKPMNIALKSIRDLFRPIETAGENAIDIIKSKMLEYTKVQTAKA